VLEPVKQVQEKRARARQGSRYLDGHALTMCSLCAFPFLSGWCTFVWMHVRRRGSGSHPTREASQHTTERLMQCAVFPLSAHVVWGTSGHSCAERRNDHMTCMHGTVHGTVSPMANPLTPIDLRKRSHTAVLHSFVPHAHTGWPSGGVGRDGGPVDG
jgi:hypothetical protein